MKKVKIVIERSKDFYWAYAENVKGVSGGGNTVAAAKNEVLACIETMKDLGDCPKILKSKYEIVYKFDTQSFLNYYSGIFTKAALERITGINQKQIQHYASGLKKPRPAQAQKIEQALHGLGNELLSIHL
ncbi:MAG TPA: helix-turn-helix transcriptional regulator [Flavipsychrobacter sp.]|nr:helix-turn-helix transcriptional regulator [Flavipsychrobacter sp.]